MVGLFRINGSESFVGQLELHFMYLNYSVLDDCVGKAHEVAKSITNILSKLADKIIPYKFFDSFMKICA